VTATFNANPVSGPPENKSGLTATVKPENKYGQCVAKANRAFKKAKKAAKHKHGKARAKRMKKAKKARKKAVAKCKAEFK